MHGERNLDQGANPAAVTNSTMAHSSITTTFTGPGNQGLQVGYNSGSLEAHFHAPERPETPPQPSCFVPFPRDLDFVGRGTLLDQIRERCTARASRVALVGLGGVGKSQLAIEHCYRTVEQSPETWVFWAHASSTARLEQSFREIADQVKALGRKDSQADVFKLVHDWLRDRKNGRWLLVLDNADDAAALCLKGEGDSGGSSAVQQHVLDYLPSSSHGSILVTSRTKGAAMQIVEENDTIAIDPMDNVAAHTLLRKKLGGTSEEDSSIAQLATTLDHMPLALVQAAAYIRERAPRCSVQQYLEQYWQSDSSKTSLLNKEAGHLRRDRAASNSILITWQISFNHIRNTRQSAAGLLSLMSFFDQQGIQEELLLCRPNTIVDNGMTAVHTQNDFEDDVLALRDYSLITAMRDAKTFKMHSLVQLATRTWLESKGQIDRWREQFISNLCAELPRGNYENWKKCQALFPHAQAALAQRPKKGEALVEWARVLYKAASYAWRQGRAGEAEQMAVMSLKVMMEVLGEENAETIDSMEMVGLVKTLRGEYKEAEAMHKQELLLRERVLGQEHPDTLSCIGNLGLILNKQGKYEEAEAVLRQRLALEEKVLGHEHLDTITSMSDLALVLNNQGKYEEAETRFRQALAMYKKVLGHEHPETLVSMNNLAQVLCYQSKYKEAEMMCGKTLALVEKVLGHEHPETLTTMNNFALVLVVNGQGRYKEAEAMFHQALALQEKVLGHEHPETLVTVSNLAYLLNRTQHYDESFTLCERACIGFETVLGLDHPYTRQCRQLYTNVKKEASRSKSVSILRDTRAMEEAGESGSMSVQRYKTSRLLRGLAKMGIGRLKQPKG
ncbi:TPR-like protein [Phaeosphaeriaceae sp. SRC1lsM3a]|nr:TPR-like protein [Stagonospora sp. SRC1lsM3a]